MFTTQDLVNNIKKVYLQKDRFEMQKHIADFHDESGAYVWDYFNLFIQERIQNQAPKLYHIGWPFDLISNKAPQRALIFQNGELLFDQDITHEVNVRTAAMNFVVLSALWVGSLGSKKILLVGTGNVWKEFLKQLKDFDDSVTSLDYSNTRDKDEEFESLGATIGVSCNPVQLTSLESYDIIALHTSSRKPVISKELFATVKHTAIVTSFMGGHGEIEWSVYDGQVQVIIDRAQTLKDAKELALQIENGSFSKDSVILLDELLSGAKKPNNEKPIIYRSTGAPMQSLAILQLMAWSH